MKIYEKMKNIPLQEAFQKLGIEGSGLKYRCFNPEHDDRSPSLYSEPRENYFHCVGCGIGGDIGRLYELRFGIDRKEAIGRIVNDFGVGSPYKKAKESARQSEKYNRIKLKKWKKFRFLCPDDEYTFDERAGIYEYCGHMNRKDSEESAMEPVASERLKQNKRIFQEFFEYCVSCFKLGIDEKALEYLLNHRGLSEDIVRKHKLFTVSDYCETNEYLKSKFEISDLNGSGLFSNGNLLFKDSHRLIIPYIEDNDIVYLRSRNFDKSGNTNSSRLKYFGLKSDDTNLNRTTRFYNKDILATLQESAKLYICEGELDCLMLETYDMSAVAIPGTNNFPVDEIHNLTEFRITLCFDNDPPGLKATEKISDELLGMVEDLNFSEMPSNVKDVSDFFAKYSTASGIGGE